MADDTEEPEPQSRFSFSALMQKIPLLLGIAVMLWMMTGALLHPRPAKLNTQPRTTTQPHQPNTTTQQNSNPVAPDISEKIRPDDNHAANPEVLSQAEHSDAADKKHIASLEDKVAKLERELADIKSQADERGHDIKKDGEALGEKLEQHEKLMKSMKAQIDSLQDNNAEMLKAMKAQMDALKESSANQLSAITAFSIMKDAALRGEPFDTELKQLAGIIHNAEQTALLSQLKPFADNGIVTLESLQNQFEKLLPVALSPGHETDTLSHNLKSLIVIRKEGEDQQGSDDESVLARAEAKINRGEIAGGLKEMQALSPPVADTMADWIKNAKAYVDGRNALNALHVLLLKDASDQPTVTATKAAPTPVPAPIPVLAPLTQPKAVVKAPVAPEPKPADQTPEKPAEAAPTVDDSVPEQQQEIVPAPNENLNSSPKQDTVNE